MLCLPCALVAAVAPAERSSADTSLTGIVKCAGQKQFRMKVDRQQAVIWLGRQILVLRRSVSENLKRYSAPNAALAIEGDYVAFVMDDALDFEECHLNRGNLDGPSTRM